MQIDFPSALAGLAKAVAVATVIGGGTMVLDAQRGNALQDQAIHQLDERQNSLDETLKSLDKSVRDLDKSVAVLTERMEK